MNAARGLTFWALVLALCLVSWGAAIAIAACALNALP